MLLSQISKDTKMVILWKQLSSVVVLRTWKTFTRTEVGEEEISEGYHHCV